MWSAGYSGRGIEATRGSAHGVHQSFCGTTLQYIDGGEALSAAVAALVWLASTLVVGKPMLRVMQSNPR